MIYLLQKSKKSSRRREFKATVNEAKEFLYNIDTRKFKISEIIIYSSDTKEEMLELRKYFIDDYFETITDDVITVVRINENISKYNRLRNPGITIKALNNFRAKIEKAIDGSSVTISYGVDTFEISIIHPTGDVKIVCNYKLVIQEAFASNEQGGLVNLNDNDSFVKIVNKLFIKQRYYYKTKK